MFEKARIMPKPMPRMSTPTPTPMSLPNLSRLSLLSGSIAGQVAAEPDLQQTDMPSDVARTIADLANKPLKSHYIEAIAFLDPRFRPLEHPLYTLSFDLRPEHDGEVDLDYLSSWEEHVKEKYDAYSEAWARKLAAGRRLTEQSSTGPILEVWKDISDYKEHWLELQNDVATAEEARKQAAERVGRPKLEGPPPDGCTELECRLATAFLELDGGRAFGAPLQRGDLLLNRVRVLENTLEIELLVDLDKWINDPNESMEEVVLRTTSEAYHRSVLILGTRAVVSVLAELLNTVPHPTKRDFTADELVLDTGRTLDHMVVEPYEMEGLAAPPGGEILPGRLIGAPICFGTDGCGEPLRQRIAEQMQQALWLAGAYGSREGPSKKEEGSCVRCMRSVVGGGA